MIERKYILEVDDLRLLPSTRDFFDNKVSRGVNVFIYSIIFIFVALIAWGFIGRMDDVVKATAVLRPIDNISELKSLSNGEIVEKNYVQNQSVHKGDLLLALDCSSEQIELINLDNSIERVDNELKNNNILLSYIIGNAIEEPLSSEMVTKINYYKADYDKMLLQISDLEEKYNFENSLPDNMKAQFRIEESLTQLEQAKLTLDSWKNNQIINITSQIESNKEQQQNLKLRRKILERTIKNSSIYSPIDGIIDEITPLNVGDYILGGSNILRIVPSDKDQLKAEIILKASDIARVKVGQEVKIRFPGLPPSSFGQLKGIINLIPADITINSNEPIFVVEAELPETFLTASNGDKINLRSGLSAEARIIISHDSIIKMVMRKLDFVN